MAGKKPKKLTQTQLKEKLRKKLRDAKVQKPDPKKTRTRNDLKNILVCSLAAIIVVIFTYGLLTEYYLPAAGENFESSLVLILILGYATIYLAVLAAGFMFSSLSLTFGYYPKKGSIESKIYNFIDKFLWWLIPIMGIIGFVIYGLVVECFYYTC